MKVNDIIFYYSIRIDFITNKVTQEKKEHKIVGYNQNYLAINDFLFTTVKHTKMYRGDKETLFNEVSIYDTSSWNITSYDHICANLYTQTPNSVIAYKRMKKALEKFIYKKHGRYCNAITFLDKIVFNETA